MRCPEGASQLLPYMKVPSKLIRVALTDLSICEADDAYVINMYDWHLPDMKHVAPVCFVCLAGAVIAQTLNVSPDQDWRPISRCSSEPMSDIERILHALNYFRSGDIEEAFKCLRLDPQLLDMGLDRYIPRYEYDSESREFKLALEELASDLEREGY